MDFRQREEVLRKKNAGIGVATDEQDEVNEANDTIQDEKPSRVTSRKIPQPKEKLTNKTRGRSRARTTSESSTSLSQDVVASNSSITEKKESKRSALKKVNLAIVKQRKTVAAQTELLKALDEYKRENEHLQDELKEVNKANNNLHSQVAKMTKKEEKFKHDIESNNIKVREAENENSTLRSICDRLERELKQRDNSAKSDAVRLTRQEEQLAKMKLDQTKLQENNSTLKDELRNLKELHQKQVNLKEKQIEQLLDGFQKQMQLIDVLRRQKLHLEAAHILQYTEDEFLQTLDWKPFGNNGEIMNQSG